ncbi:MAG: 3-phosphoglycerate dehydrogenase [Gammaproteobacteria bacterium]|nr:3-phosphoglycerate dehydrogenase [Gammaproteobacteria bacterium]|tara:strand:- start:711 stop:1886 length:1176 start_codon:yes stop_codon:yes gene_type:complete
MYRIRCLNNVSKKGLKILSDLGYEIDTGESEADAIILRSYKLADEDIKSSLRAIGRAGAGVNNIPVELCTEKGIVVFNTPGANANAVKELVLAGLLLSSRGIVEGVNFVRELESINDKTMFNKTVEEGKKAFKGTELKGKTLGVLGLGAIGSMVADMALALGMKVIGYDPALSVAAAWRVSSQIKRIDNLANFFSNSDIVTLHVPATEETIGLVDETALSSFKNGSVLLNFSREEIVNEKALKAALESGKIMKFVSDFPCSSLLGMDQAILIPHLGASTAEAEENCALMVATQLGEFLENGSIKNSVNFPDVSLERVTGSLRLAIVNRNVPRILGSILSILADRNINVLDMLNKSRGDIAYNLIDIEAKISDDLIDEIERVDGVVSIRYFD